MGIKINLEFFNNKRLMVALSGVASVMMALLIFFISLIGFDNFSAFVFGASPASNEPVKSPTQIIVPTAPPETSTTQAPTQTALPGTTMATQATTEIVTTEPKFETSAPPITTVPTEIVTETVAPTPTEISVTSIKIDQGTEKEIFVNDNLNLTVSVVPLNATNKTVTWSCTDSSVAIVDATTGKVVAIKEGETYVKATSADGKVWTQIKLKVKPKVIRVESVQLTAPNNVTSIKVGETLAITVNVYPANSTNKTVKWKIDDTSAAKFTSDIGDSRATIEALTEGTVIITATVDEKVSTITIHILPENIPDDTTPSASTEISGG